VSGVSLGSRQSFADVRATLHRGTQALRAPNLYSQSSYNSAAELRNTMIAIRWVLALEPNAEAGKKDAPPNAH
jgi:hypothetical protein